METLLQQADSFLGVVRRHVLPGFSEFVKDIYSSDYQTVYNILSDLRRDIFLLAKQGQVIAFSEKKAQYMSVFGEYNSMLARHRHMEKVKEFKHMGSGAVLHAALELLQDPRYRRWLSISVLLRNDKGESVTLVSSQGHAPAIGYYVTLEELETLRLSGTDPWEFVKRRTLETSNININDSF